MSLNTPGKGSRIFKVKLSSRAFGNVTAPIWENKLIALMKRRARTLLIQSIRDKFMAKKDDKGYLIDPVDIVGNVIRIGDVAVFFKGNFLGLGIVTAIKKTVAVTGYITSGLSSTDSIPDGYSVIKYSNYPSSELLKLDKESIKDSAILSQIKEIQKWLSQTKKG